MTHTSRKKSNRRRLQKEETRRIIIGAAYSLFRRRGYDNTTMRELAEEADVGLGTIFQHFPDKPALLISAFSEDIATVFAGCLTTMPPANIKMQLAHIAAEFYDFCAQNLSLSRTLIKEGLFRPERDLDVLTANFLATLENLFRRAIGRGELDHGTDVRAGVLAFLAFFLSGLIGGLKEESFDSRKQTFFFVSLLENYLKTTSEDDTSHT